MKLRPPSAQRAMIGRLHITSMIDVIFLLLIFFMTTTTLTTPEAQLTSGLRAEQTASASAADFEPQIVDVQRDGERDVFRLGERTFTDQASLIEALRTLPLEQGVFVRVSDRAGVSAAASAVQACRDAGFRKVSYVPAP